MKTGRLSELLTTKLYIPQPRPSLVARPRLIKKLNANPGRKMTLVCAPAGFGKTTLVAEWVCNSPREVAWLSVDEGDNDPAQFLAYLIAAFQQVDGRIGQTARHILQSPQVTPHQGLVTSLINDVSAVDSALTLVLDDYHLISAAPVHAMLGFLVEHQPPPMHLVICTRQDPPLPLPRLRARGQVTEIREADLRFTAEEAAAFLNQTMDLNLSPEVSQILEARTEGWITGLQLAALALQEQGEQAEAAMATCAGDDRYVMDYLLAEVLERQPEQVRSFLRRTAILDRLNASLCSALTGREDSQAILEGLAAANLFVIPLDHRREWCRYHRLFAEVLRTRLDREEEKGLHQQAARWFEQHQLLPEAIRHALACASAFGDPTDPEQSGGQARAGQAWDDAERLIRLAAEDMILSGRVLTVGGWLDTLPEKRVRADGQLATYKAWVLTLTGEMALAEEYTAAAESCLRQQKARAGDLGKLLALRCLVALLVHQDCERAIQLAADALQALDSDQRHWRIIALWAMAEAQERTRPISEAVSAFRAAAQAGRALGSQAFVVVAEMSLAAALNASGQRREAVTVCEQAIERYTDQARRVSPLASLVFSRLGMLHYEANQLETARDYINTGVALSEQIGLASPRALSLSGSAFILYAQGETEAALRALQSARQLASQEAFGDVDWLLAYEADMRLKQGDLTFALRWAETTGLSPEHVPDYLHLERHLAYGRLLLAQGRLSDAQRWLARLERFMQDRRLYRWLISAHILQALARQRSGQRQAARDHLAQALQLAAPEDYYRAFLDEDVQVLEMLPPLRHVTPVFVDQLLAYAGAFEPGVEASEPGLPGVAQPLLEPLSERELEVLALLAAGLSNREIADRLVITLGTAKRHASNIYAKLDVTSRTQAVAKARALGLL